MLIASEELAKLRAERYNATVILARQFHSDLMVLRVRPDFPRPKYLAGQYCTLGLAYGEPRVAGCQQEDLKPEDFAKIVRRSYSISSSFYHDGTSELRNPDGDDWLEFYIVLVRENPEGRVPALTPRLFALAEGDRVQVGEKIVGHFTLEPVNSTGDAIVFLGTGTGEAPHNSMACELLRTGHSGPILNVCCVRYTRDLGYLETHRRLMDQFPNYRYIPLTTREGPASQKKYIQDLIVSGELEGYLGRRLDPARAHAFLCGNPKMIGIPVRNKATDTWEYPQPTGAIELLEQRGFKADNPALKVDGTIHFEKYW